MVSGPTLFDDLVIAERPMTLGVPRTRPKRRRPMPLAATDHHPEAEARFDVLFTHEQMAALNGTSAQFYERWGVRVNKSQLLRALLAGLRDARPAVDALLCARVPSRRFRAPPKAAAASIHRAFEAELAAVLVAAIRDTSQRR